MFENLKDLGNSLIDGFIWLVTSLPLALLELVPVPDWMVDTSIEMPSGVLWFASAFELPAGLAIMASAWAIRFFIRRLPVIG